MTGRGMTPLARFRALYGAGPLNLLVLLLAFAIAGFAVAGWFERPRDLESVLIWFAAAIVLHDVIFVPLYTLLDRIVFGLLRRPRSGAARGRTVLGVVGSTPYLRIPAILSGLLLLVFFPVIFGLGRQTELSASGIAESGYLARWLIATGVLFGVSGVAWGVATRREAARRGAMARAAAARVRPVAPSAMVGPEVPAPPAAPTPPVHPGAAAPPADPTVPGDEATPGASDVPAAPEGDATPQPPQD